MHHFSVDLQIHLITDDSLLVFSLHKQKPSVEPAGISRAVDHPYDRAGRVKSAAQNQSGGNKGIKSIFFGLGYGLQKLRLQGTGEGAPIRFQVLHLVRQYDAESLNPDLQAKPHKPFVIKRLVAYLQKRIHGNKGLTGP